MRISNFQNFDLFPDPVAQQFIGNATMHVHGVYIPGTLSFNIVAIPMSVGNTSLSCSLSFGLYSLNGSTLSLANSASGQVTASGTLRDWFTLATSATQDITPGNWYFAMITSSSSANSLSIFCNATLTRWNDAVIGGPFVRGWAKTSQTALPASIATSDLNQEGLLSFSGGQHHPYILVSA